MSSIAKSSPSFNNETFKTLTRDIKQIVKNKCIIDWDNIKQEHKDKHVHFYTDQDEFSLFETDIYHHVVDIKNSFSANGIKRLRNIIHYNSLYIRAFIASVRALDSTIDDIKERELFTSIIIIKTSFNKNDIDELLVKMYKLSTFI
jgi:hypothetical protein